MKLFALICFNKEVLTMTFIEIEHEIKRIEKSGISLKFIKTEKGEKRKIKRLCA